MTPEDLLHPPPLRPDGTATRHPVQFWTPPRPQALLVCADGEGLGGWAQQLSEAELPVAAVGIVSGAPVRRVNDAGPPSAYDPRNDPRARAYLPGLDPAYFRAHLDYVMTAVLQWADEQLGAVLPRVAFGVSNGGAWAVCAAASRPEAFVGVLGFSLAAAPEEVDDTVTTPHALVAGTREPPFLEVTRSYAEALRRSGVPVRLRTPDYGHDYAMWAEEFLPALRWVIETAGV